MTDDIPIPEHLEYLTLRQLAQIAGISRQAIDKHRKRGRLRTELFGGDQFLVSRAEADRWLRERKADRE